MGVKPGLSLRMIRLRVYENRVLRRIFGTTSKEERGGVEEERRTCVNLTKHYLGDKIKKKEIGGVRSTYGEEKRLYRALWEKPEGKRLLGRPSHRSEDNIKVDLQEIGEDVE